MADERPWRAIVRRDTSWDERATLTARTFSWSATPVHELTLECGHTQTRRGHSSPPKSRVVCKACAKGKPPAPVTVEPGVFDRTRDASPTAAPLVSALLSSAREKVRDG